MTDDSAATAAPLPDRRRLLRRLAMRLALYGTPIGFLVGGWALMLRMPGDSHPAELPAPSPAETSLSDELRGHVETLSGEIGPRNFSHLEGLARAERYVADELAASGHEVRRHAFEARGHEFCNLEIEIVGSERPDEIVVVGAHYDTCHGPGADDNASGTAALLALARRLGDARPARTLRLVAFVNEEPPFFQSESMGSLVYARACRERGDDVVAMISLEMLGFYVDEEGSQTYPSWLYELVLPSTGNFIGFVGNVSSRDLVHRSIDVFRRHATIPSEGAALPERVVGLSDQWSFWQVGYPALMVTNTAMFRNPNYHELTDTPETLDYERMARVVAGLEHVVRDLTE